MILARRCRRTSPHVQRWCQLSCPQGLGAAAAVGLRRSQGQHARLVLLQPPLHRRRQVGVTLGATPRLHLRGAARLAGPYLLLVALLLLLHFGDLLPHLLLAHPLLLMLPLLVTKEQGVEQALCPAGRLRLPGELAGLHAVPPPRRRHHLSLFLLTAVVSVQLALATEAGQRQRQCC